jgi:hypothetical protein
MKKNVIYIVLCLFLYACNSGKDDYCQTCNEIESYVFNFTFLFSKDFERTYNQQDLCYYPDYMPSDVIIIKEKEKEWNDSRIKICINLDSLRTISNSVSDYLDDVEKYIITSTKRKRKTLTRNNKTIEFVEYLDEKNNLFTLITYYYRDNFLIRKRIQIQEFKIDDYELIEQLLFA